MRSNRRIFSKTHNLKKTFENNTNNRNKRVKINMDSGDMKDEIEINVVDVDMEEIKHQQKKIEEPSTPPKPTLEVINVDFLSPMGSANDDVTPQQLLADEDLWLCSPNITEILSPVNDVTQDYYRSEGTISFTIKDIYECKDRGGDFKLLSQPIYIRNLPWKLLVLFCERSVGLFLQCNGDSNSKCWSCHAVAKIRLINHAIDEPAHTRPRIKHTFNQKENDYGYFSFISWEELLDPTKHFVYKSSVTFEVYINAEIPYGTYWDSKRHSGYVGLKNQGATCYMNSLLQSLYFTNELRRAVYRIPTEADDSSKSLGLSLQSIFYDLQLKKCAVGTERLTKSFGWNTSESLLQHDVQEFLRILLDKLETKMKGTTIEGTIPNLFEGKTSSYVYCKTVDYSSRHYETFYDIQLNIKDKKNIYESFLEYTASESLDGDNKYFAGMYGLQEAVKGVVFHSFPPVLHLHLLRFQYDPIISNSVKNNDYFEFYEHINLDGYLFEQETTPADYVLQAVLVHSGDNQSGHYVVFISPKADGEWYKFDDNIVAKCKKSEAIEDNYGGLEENACNQTDTSAYMLVYIRKSKIDYVLADIPENEIPSDLTERLDLEKRIEKACRRELLEPNLYTTASVVLEEMFHVHNKKFLFDESKIKHRLFKFKLSQTIQEMIECFANAFGVPQTRMRVWNMTNEEPQQFMYLDSQEEGEHKIEDIVPVDGSWYIFLEFARPDKIGRPLPPFNAQTEILLFLKFFNPRDKSLNYIGCSQEPLTRKISDLIPEVNKHLGFDIDTELQVTDEYKSQEICLEENKSLGSIFYFHQEHKQGQVIVFERKNGNTPSVISFLTDLLFRVDVSFCERFNSSEPDIIIELSHHANYEQMAEALAERLNTEPQKIQFFLNVNSKPIPYNFTGMLCQLFTRMKDSGSPKFYYEKLAFNVHELEDKKQFKCTWYSKDFKEQKDLVLLVNKNINVKELLEEAMNHIPVEENVPKKLALVKVNNDRIIATYKSEALLDRINDSYITSTSYLQHEFHIEELPPEDLGEFEIFIPVGHYCKDIHNSFGVPFLVRACHGETYGEVMERIRNRLNVPDKEWENYKFAVALKGGYTMDVDSSTIVDLKVFKITNASSLPFFGINHINKLKRNSSNNSVEKALKIYN